MTAGLADILVRVHMNRVIYTYWHEAPFPPLMMHCVSSWTSLNPDYEVVIVDKRFAMEHLSPPEWFAELIPQHQADWVRLKLLAERGGVWLDATSYLLKPVTAWASDDKALSIFAIDGFDKQKKDLKVKIMKRIDCRGSVRLENWALACPKGHDFVLAWFDQFETACALGHVAYVARLKKQGLYPKCFVHRLPYFNQHLAASVVYHNRLHRDPVRVLSMCRALFCNVSMLASCLTDPPSDQRLFFKMTGGLRKYLHFMSGRGLYFERSLAAQAYNMPRNPWIGRCRLLFEVFIILLILKALK